MIPAPDPGLHRDAAAPDTSDNAFARTLRHEVVLSERRRVLGLAGVLAAITLIILLARTIAPRVIEAFLHGQVPLATVFVIFLPFIAYELFVAALFTFFISRKRDIPVFGRYVNAFIETTLASVLIYLLARAVAGVALSGWPSLLYFLFIILSALRLDFALSAFTGAVAAIELFVLAERTLPLTWVTDDPYFSLVFHLGRSAMLLFAGVLAGLVGRQLKAQFARALAAAATRDRMTNLFGQHVSPQVVERLLAAGTAELSETRRVCVMFVDIRGFTAAARDRAPTQVVDRLNAVFALLVAIVDRHHGIVNKFLGDGFLAIFGAPFDDPAAVVNAVTTGREMLEALARSNAESAWPIRIGIGIHVGEAVTGTVGSPRRKEYTVIGDTVNLASRLEALNKEFGSQLLVSQAVHESAPEAMREAQPLGGVTVRGYAEPVEVWRLA